jgi:hypothetical protein
MFFRDVARDGFFQFAFREIAPSIRDVPTISRFSSIFCKLPDRDL